MQLIARLIKLSTFWQAEELDIVRRVHRSQRVFYHHCRSYNAQLYEYFNVLKVINDKYMTINWVGHVVYHLYDGLYVLLLRILSVNDWDVPVQLIVLYLIPNICYYICSLLSFPTCTVVLFHGRRFTLVLCNCRHVGRVVHHVSIGHSYKSVIFRSLQRFYSTFTSLQMHAVASHHRRYVR